MSITTLLLHLYWHYFGLQRLFLHAVQAGNLEGLPSRANRVKMYIKITRSLHICAIQCKAKIYTQYKQSLCNIKCISEIIAEFPLAVIGDFQNHRDGFREEPWTSDTVG